MAGRELVIRKISENKEDDFAGFIQNRLMKMSGDMKKLAIKKLKDRFAGFIETSGRGRLMRRAGNQPLGGYIAKCVRPLRGLYEISG